MPTPLAQALNPNFQLRSSKKRVRFEETGSAPETKRHRVIEFRPLCAEIPADEKRIRWLQDEDKVALRKLANSEAQACRMEDNRKILRGQSSLALSEIYSTVHSLCVQANLSESEDIFTLISPEVVSVFAMSDGRGLEDRIIPRTALERRELRIQSIRAVLLAQSKGADEEQLCRVAMAFTSPARKFAEALGVADATAAMLEYSQDSVPPPQEVPEPSPLPRQQHRADYVQFGPRIPLEAQPIPISLPMLSPMPKHTQPIAFPQVQVQCQTRGSSLYPVLANVF